MLDGGWKGRMEVEDEVCWMEDKGWKMEDV